MLWIVTPRSKTALFFVACDANPDTREIPDAMRIKGYSPSEAADRSLQQQERCEADKIKGEAIPGPPLLTRRYPASPPRAPPPRRIRHVLRGRERPAGGGQGRSGTVRLRPHLPAATVVPLVRVRARDVVVGAIWRVGGQGVEGWRFPEEDIGGGKGGGGVHGHAPGDVEGDIPR